MNGAPDGALARRGSPGRRPLVGFYADDFTGASENLAQFHRHGLGGRLCFHADAADDDGPDGTPDVLGIAGTARALDPDAMRAELRPAFAALARRRPAMIQYKLCSTFDSSAMRGNFAVAAHVARATWPRCVFPVLAAVPEFGRHTVFGNHFAAGIDAIHRLDRHPTMATHPSTPMREADLRAHLVGLGFARAGGLDLIALRRGAGAAAAALAARFANDPDAPVVIDTLTSDDLAIACEALDEVGSTRDLFVLGAQGFAQGIGALLAARRAIASPPRVPVAPVDRLLALCGSRAPPTAIQVAHARAAGFDEFAIDPRMLDTEAGISAIVAQVVKRTSEGLRAGRSLVVHTSPGWSTDAPADPQALARSIGACFARLLPALVERHRLARVAMLGGDTSSAAMRASGARALEVAACRPESGAHVFRLVAPGSGLDRLQVLLKGGQVGGSNYLVDARDGGP